jgi:transposase
MSTILPKTYQTDLTDEQWAILQPLIILPDGGRPNFKRTKQFENINEALRRQVRVQEGRNEEPSLAIIDSQSVKAANTAEERGYDAGKKTASNGIFWLMYR